MDIARSDQILADVRHCTGEVLDSSADDLLSGDKDAAECFDRALQTALVESLVRHHDGLWPSSEPTESPRKLEFGGTVFQVIARDDLWEPSIFELAYVPDLVDQRVESRFGTELSLKSPDRHSSVRLYPPRMAYPFEFHQDMVVSIVECVFAAGWAWQHGQRAGG